MMRSGAPAPIRCDCPTYSPSVLGRIRSARGICSTDICYKCTTNRVNHGKDTQPVGLSSNCSSKRLSTPLNRLTPACDKLHYGIIRKSPRYYPPMTPERSFAYSGVMKWRFRNYGAMMQRFHFLYLWDCDPNMSCCNAQRLQIITDLCQNL